MPVSKRNSTDRLRITLSREYRNLFVYMGNENAQSSKRRPHLYVEEETPDFKKWKVPDEPSGYIKCRKNDPL